MESKKLVSFEKELKKLKFKKVYFDDLSAYWFTKRIKYKDFDLQILCEPDNSLLLLEIRVGSYQYRKVTFNEYYDSIKKFPCTINNIKLLLKRYK